MLVKRTCIVRIKEIFIEKLLFLCSLLSVFTTVGIILVLSFETFEFFKEVTLLQFLTDTQWTPLFINKHFGILPLLCGTLLTSLIALVVAMPIGVVSAVYLSGFNALSSGIVMGIMIIPLVSSLSEDAMRSVPMGLREGAYALGSNKLQVSFRIVFPAALSGITAAFILAMSRAIGETMIVAIAAGQQPKLTLNPLVPIETITAYIVQVSLGDTPYGTLEYRTIFACGMSLFILTFILNMVSFKLKERFQEVYE